MTTVGVTNDTAGNQIPRNESSLTEKLRKLRERYADTFTIHGFSHIRSGNIYEKVLWAVCVIGAFIGTILMTYGLFQSYLNNDVDTKINILQKVRIKLPTIYICDSLFSDMIVSYGNCSSTSSDHYDHQRCPDLVRKCPRFCDDGNCLSEDPEFNLTCPEQFHRQCIALNMDGTHEQTFSKSWYTYEPIGWSEDHYPLEMYVRPPGEMYSLIPVLYDNQYHEISRDGVHLTYMEKTTIHRQPPPYTNCIDVNGEEGNAKNMFLGPYTIDKCLATCKLKNKWHHCNTTYWSARNMVRDKSLKRVDRAVDEISECLASYRSKVDEKYKLDGIDDVALCYEDCWPPCSEESYKFRVETEPDVYEGSGSIVFYFTIDRKVTTITEEPKQQLLVVLSALGGTLGLLAGVSVLSLLELLIWMTLFIMEKIIKLFSR